MRRIMTLLIAEAPANFVPAAAVTRRGRVLFNMTGRLGHVGCFFKLSENIKVTAWSAIFLLSLSTENRSIEFLV
jgi:hypothetical protein